jgi:hypothetical protein
MIEAIPAITIEQKQVIVEATKNSNFTTIPLNARHMYGYWENGVCVGGSGVGVDGVFLYVLETAPSLWIPKSLSVMLKDVLPIYGELKALISNQNVRCIKAVTSVGFKKIYSTESEVTYVLTKELWRFKKRWPL